MKKKDNLQKKEYMQNHKYIRWIKKAHIKYSVVKRPNIYVEHTYIPPISDTD